MRRCIVCKKPISWQPAECSDCRFISVDALRTAADRRPTRAWVPRQPPQEKINKRMQRRAATPKKPFTPDPQRAPAIPGSARWMWERGARLEEIAAHFGCSRGHAWQLARKGA